MKSFIPLALCSIFLFAGIELAIGQDSLEGDLATIRQSIDSYVAAFNKGDSQAVAAHWTKDGEFITPAGERLVGHQQLAEDFAAYFTESAGAKIELVETSVELVSPSVARETGVARVIVPEQEPNESEYEAIHVKTPSGWRIDSVREFLPLEPPPSHYDQLQALEWLVGTWIDADEGSTIETKCRWTKNQNYLVRSFKVVVEDRIDFEGTQIIGWDSHAGTIRSWTFDSDGGFGVGRWSGDGERWTVLNLNVLPDGRRASSTNIYGLIDENHLQFRSIGRQVDGELMPNIDPVSIVRVAE